MIASIKIVADTKYPKEIIESLKIDNINIPNNMKISMNYSDKQIFVEITINIESAKSILTLRNTADEILEQIGLLDKLLQKDDR